MLLARNRGFRLLFSASAVSNLGDGISALAFPWLATLLTRDPLLIGAVAAAGRLPWLLFSVPAGVVVDRADRRRLMVRADVLRAGLSVGVIALIAGAGPPLPDGAPGASSAALALASLAFLLGTAEVVRDNAAQTVLPSLVAREDLEHANGQLLSAERTLSFFVGPPLAGFLIAWAVPLPFAVDALGFAIAAWLAWGIVLPSRTAVVRAHFVGEMRDGWRWLRAHPTLLRLAVVLGGLNFCSAMAFTLLVLVSQEVMGLGAPGHGLVLSSAALGAVASGLCAARLAGRIGGHGIARARRGHDGGRARDDVARPVPPPPRRRPRARGRGGHAMERGDDLLPAARRPGRDPGPRQRAIPLLRLGRAPARGAGRGCRRRRAGARPRPGGGAARALSRDRPRHRGPDPLRHGPRPDAPAMNPAHGAAIGAPPAQATSR